MDKESPKDAALTPPPTPPSFGAQVRTACGMLVVLTVLTGVAYPLVVTGVARAAFPDESAGSLVRQDGKVRGSRLIGQPFDDPKYFWGRISATSPSPYNASNSGASNLGPTNKALTDAARARVELFRAADPGNDAPLPVDLVTASGSGLDPHISLAGAEYQVARIARLRSVPEARVRELVRANTDARDLAVLGEPGVNVLRLNLALDAER